MRRLFQYAIFLATLHGAAQQTIMYTQYVFNKAGMNPAASGVDINQKYYYAFGAGRQWAEFDNAPKTNFVNFSYTIRPPRAYRFWQNASIYIDNDDSGMLGNNNAYLGYTFHALIRKKLVASAGIYAGVRLFQRSTGLFDANDPAVQRSRQEVLTYPDIIPGVRLENSKFFIDLSARQISIVAQKDLFSSKRIGSPSILYPHVYIAYGRKQSLTESLLMMPSVAATLPLIGVPVTEAGVMFYYASKVGLGASLRNLSFASGILQVRFFQSFTVGFAYSYPINDTRFGNTNSYEIMVGVVPYGMDAKSTGKHSVARCPSLSY